MEEGFDEILAAVSTTLGDTIAEYRACEDGIDASPVSNPCERAKREYTSVLFNLESQRLQGSCALDSTEGLGAADVSSMVGALAALINSGDENHCTEAAAAAAVINDGAIVQESGNVTAGPVVASSASRRAARLTGRSTATVAPAPRALAAETAKLSGSPGLVPQAAHGLRPSQAPANEAADEEEDRTRIHRHLAVLGNPAAPRRATVVSVDELLTTLSGGYDLDLRLQVAAALVSRIDDSLTSLLVAHLHHMRMEAQERDLPDRVKELEALLARVLPVAIAG